MNQAELDKELDTVLNNRNHADYECYMALKQLLVNVDPTSLKKAIANANCGDMELAEETLENINDVMEAREKYNEEFMNLISSGLKKISA